ncbi:MAG: hypothetical protein JST53_03985 [Actinobacteria bacterium]|nr:hypothetical protein [Actinomycetota bacterium]
MAVAAPKLKSASQAAPPPSRTAPPEPKKRPRDRPAPGKPRKIRLDDPPAKPGGRKASAGPATKAAPRRKASPGVGAAAAKVAPARKPARRKVAPKRRPASVIPIAAGHVGRAAVGVTQLPESGLIHRLTRGRLWIGLLGVLLVGIVALNVVTLSFAASSGKIDAKNTLLGKENSMLQSRVATVLGQARMRHEAAGLGLAMPTEKAPQLIEARAGDVKEAASRLGAAAPALGTTSEGEAASEEGATGEGATSTESATSTEGSSSGEEVAAAGATATGEEAVPGAESSEDLSQFTPEQIEGFEREYAELLASEGVTEAPAG